MSEPSRSAFMPREELIEKAVGRRQMSVGMPHDVHDDEKRIALTPEAVKILTDAGHEVFIRKRAQDRMPASLTGSTVTTGPLWPTPSQKIYRL
ncbi:MAG: hypothetical protein MZV63_48070 [Marinilabiliales bacterium]|nr:hypothetical protein [Marinilabiliales bacterium]